MSSAPMREPANHAAGAGQSQLSRQNSAGRRWAEWVSLAVSGVLLLSLAGYILLQALRRDPPYVVAQTRPLLDQVRQKGGTFILPLEVSNPGHVTLRDLELEVRFRAGADPWETQDLQIDYLGRQSRQTVYLYFDRNPGELKVEVRPVHYRVD